MFFNFISLSLFWELGLTEWDRNEFKIPEIIFDPTLVLSPHVCLLSMLFFLGGFKKFSTTGPVLDSPEQLYSVRVPDGLGQQKLKLKDELLDKFVFCQVVREPTGYRIVLEERLTAAMVGSRMRRCGEITGCEDPSHPYNLRYGGAKELNNSGKSLSFLNSQARLIANSMNRRGYRFSPKCHSPALRYPHLCPAL